MTFKSKHKTTVVKEQKMETGTNLVKGCSVKVSLIQNQLTHTEEFQISDSFSFQKKILLSPSVIFLLT